MSQKSNLLYKCDHCGLILEVLNGEGPTPSCCGSNMNILTENTQEAAVEKHIPVIEKLDGGYKVKVGEISHPMDENHYIEWIEVIAGDKLYRKRLAPGSAPEAFFAIDEASFYARAYCNLHGLWKNE